MRIEQGPKSIFATLKGKFKNLIGGQRSIHMSLKTTTYDQIGQANWAAIDFSLHLIFSFCLHVIVTAKRQYFGFRDLTKYLYVNF